MGPPAAYPGQRDAHPDLGQAALALANNFTAARQFFGMKWQLSWAVTSYR